MLEMNTFSVSARCQKTGMLGVAVSTAVPGVGGICPFVKPGVGAVATQSWVNPYLGIDGLKLLEQGKTAQEALDTLIAADPGRDVRQLGIVDAAGRSAAWSGAQCTNWFGHITGPDFSVQGNMLVGERTIQAMAEAFTASAGLTLPERLMAVLEAGQSAGGDKRGRQICGSTRVQDAGVSLSQFAGGRARASGGGITARPGSGAPSAPAVCRWHADPSASAGRSSQGRHRHADDASSVQAWRWRFGSMRGRNRASRR